MALSMGRAAARGKPPDKKVNDREESKNVA
jgi:hypothetical protein